MPNKKMPKKTLFNFNYAAIFFITAFIAVTFLALQSIYTSVTTQNQAQTAPNRPYIGMGCGSGSENPTIGLGQSCGQVGNVGAPLVCKQRGCGRMSYSRYCCQVQYGLCEGFCHSDNDCEEGLTCRQEYKDGRTVSLCRCAYYADRYRGVGRNRVVIPAHPDCVGVRQGIYPTPTEYIAPGERPPRLDYSGCWEIPTPPLHP